MTNKQAECLTSVVVGTGITLFAVYVIGQALNVNRPTMEKHFSSILNSGLQKAGKCFFNC